MKHLGKVTNKVICLLVVLGILFGVMPLNTMKVYATDGLVNDDPLPVQSAQSAFMYYAAAYGNFDVRGMFNGSVVKTTYSNGGYNTYLWMPGENQYNCRMDIYNFGVVYQRNGIQVKVCPELVDDGETVKLTYVLCNTNEDTKSFSIGAWADSMIGDNDSCAVYLRNNCQLIEMTDTHSAEYCGAGTQGLTFRLQSDSLTPFSGTWIGEYSNRDKVQEHFDYNRIGSYDASYYYSKLENGDFCFSGSDSALTFHWDVTLEAGEQTTRSCYYSVAPKFIIQSVDLTANAEDSTVHFNVPFVDEENRTQTLYYTLEGDAQATAVTTTGAGVTEGIFNFDAPVTSWASGQMRTIVLYGIDNVGYKTKTYTFELWWPEYNPNKEYHTLSFSNNVKGLGNVRDEEGKQLTLPADISTSDKQFNGWNTELDGTGTSYAAGDTYTMTNEDVTLYAQWKYPVETLTIGSQDEVYTGEEIKTVVVRRGTKSLVEGIDYLVEYTDNIEVGTASARIYGGSLIGEKTITYKIKPASFAEASVTVLEGLTYNRKPQTAKYKAIATTVDGSEATIKYYLETETAEDATTEFPKFTDFGEYTVNYIISAQFHNDVTGSVIVSVGKAVPFVFAVGDAIVYGDKLEDSFINATAVYNDIVVPGTFTWVNGGTTYPAVSDSKTTYYTVKFTPDDTDNYSEVLKEVRITVNKASQEAPYTAEGQDETIKSKADGKIVGVNDNMEYRSANGEWTAVPAGKTKVENLPAGTYYVRMKGNENLTASSIQRVVIGAGRMLTVTLPSADEQVGYTISASASTAAWNNNVTLTLTVKNGYTGNTVKCNGTQLTFVDGRCTIKMTSDAVITVENVSDRTAPTGTIKIGQKTWDSFQSNITFNTFIKGAQTVTITARDTGSNVDYIQYLRSDKAFTLAEIKSITSLTEYTGDTKTAEGWVLYTGPITENAKDAGKFVYYAKIVDKAGNVSYISSNGFTFDTEKPVIEGIENGKTYYTSQSVTVYDLGSGIDSVTVDGISKSASFTLAGNTNKTYTIVVKDKLGNTTTYSVTMKTISELAKSIANITEDNVKSSDEEKLNDVLDVITELDTGSATPQEKAVIEEIKTKINNLNEKIDDTNDGIKSAKTETEKYDLNDVKSSDKEDIESIKDELEAIPDETLTEDEKQTKDATVAKLNKLLDKIANEEKKLDDAKAEANKLNANDIKSSDKEKIEAAKEAVKAISDDNLTEEEKAEKQATIDKYDSLLKKISDVEKSLDNAEKKTSNFDADNVKSSDKEAIQKAKEAAESIPTDNLTEEEKENLKKTTEKLSSLLEKIEETEKSISEVKEKANTIDISTVNVDDKASIEAAKKQLEEIPTDNLTEADKKAIEDTIAKLDEAIDTIESNENVNEVVAVIEALKKTEELKLADEAAVKAAAEAYDKLSDEEKTLAGEQIKTAIEAAKTKIEVVHKNSYSPEIIEGANQKIDVSASATASFKSSAEFNEFVKVTVDGIEVEAGSYEVSNDSTRVVLSEAFIKTLDEGKHTLSIVSTNGHADTVFSIEGQASLTWLWIVLAAAVVIALVIIVFATSRKKNEKK